MRRKNSVSFLLSFLLSLISTYSFSQQGISGRVISAERIINVANSEAALQSQFNTADDGINAEMWFIK